ncbi:MAG TPA: hypothetical protein VNO33_01750, partial [Kofleriaceae bacterium]|nr:hypothetical protein [Kofleriaceae bacterium]
LYADAADHYGFSWTETGHTRLFSGDTLIGESDFAAFGFFAVPPEPGEYRIEVESIRGGPALLSTQVNLAWSFRSEQVAEGETAVLPVMAVRMMPPLDDFNRAPAGRWFAIPLSVSRQPGAPAPPLRRLTLEASFDGGAAWQPVFVLRIGDFGLALLRHPDGDGTVSLRAGATDRDDNAAVQTILDGYGMGEP